MVPLCKGSKNKYHEDVPSESESVMAPIMTACQSLLARVPSVGDWLPHMAFDTECRIYIRKIQTTRYYESFLRASVDAD